VGLLDTFPSLKGQGMISIDVETRDPDLKTNGPGYHRDAYIVGIAVGTEAGFRKYYPIAHEAGGNMNRDQVLSWLRPQLQLPVPKVGANLIYDLGFFRAAGVPVAGPFYDIQIAEPLLCETRMSYSLESLAQIYLGEGKKDDEMEAYLVEHFGKKNPKSNIWRAPGDLVAKYAEGDVDLPLRIFAIQKQKLEEENLWDLFILESKLIPMLLDMRFRGVKVDLVKAQRMYDELTAKQEAELAEIEAVARAKISPWNAKDLAVLFDALGLDYPRTPKTKAPSFTALWLERCDYPIAQKVLEVRKMDKLRETFLKGCLLESHYRGRIHCQFNQLKSDAGGTVSGRFSSCVAPWTLITTRNGLIRIDDVKIGDEVWTHRGKWRKVLRVYRKPSEPMLHVKTNRGDILTCTSAHRLWIDDSWVTVGELQHVFKTLGVKGRERRESLIGLPTDAFSDSDTDRRRTANELQQRELYREQVRSGRREKSSLDSNSFLTKDGNRQPHARKTSRGSSQLEGCLRWKEWILHTLGLQWGKDTPYALCTSSRTRIGEVTPRMGDTSYRPGQNERLLGQPSISYETGPQKNPCLLSTGQPVASIEEIENCGSYEVWDITVEEDESYEACGLFNHNSTPNLQFIPTRTDDGKLIRSMFLPDDGQDFYSIDYSQIEYRLMAHDAYTHKLPGAAEVVEKYKSDSGVDFHQIVAEMTGLSRSAAKTVNFGIAYGEGVAKLCASLGLTEDAGRALLEEYHSRAPFMRPLSRRASHLAASTGIVTTLLGRKRRFDAWAVVNKSGETSIVHHRIPGAKRAFTHKALNARIQGSAADIMKKAMVDIYESGVCDVLGVPQLTVHDELCGSLPRTKVGEEAFEEMKHLMENTVRLSVPLTVDAKVGANWKECK